MYIHIHTILDYHIISGKNKHIINQSYANKSIIYKPIIHKMNTIIYKPIIHKMNTIMY